MTSVPDAVGGGFANAALSGSLVAAIAVAFVAGAVSFASPCIVPLVPGYLAYVTGMTGVDAGRASRPRLVAGALLFVAGFTVVFVALLATAAGLAGAIAPHLDVIVRALGVVVIVLGLAFAGAFPFLQDEKRLHLTPRAGLWGAPVLGATLALGWTPCIGPTLAAVTTLALDDATVGRGAILAFAYSLGLGLPFVLIAVGVERSGPFLRWLRARRRPLMIVGGAMLVLLGLLLVTGAWQAITSAMQSWIDGFWVAV